MSNESLIKADRVSMEDYLKDFVPSFENFCQKCPLQPRPEIVNETGALYLTLPNDPENPLIFKIDPLIEKQEQIRNIKKKLEGNYPVIFEKLSYRYSADEIEKMVSEGITLSEALNKQKETYLPRYKIIRVHHTSQEIDCFDFKKKTKVKFKMLVPLISFLGVVQEGNREKISETFFKNKKFVMQIK